MTMDGRYSCAPGGSATVSAPKWFRAAIADGLTRLIALSLPGQPSHETIALTKEAWIETLYDGRQWFDTDAPRIAQAFRQMMRRIDRWPAPRVLLEHLPARAEQAKLPESPISDAQRAANRQRLRELASLIGKTP
ncbi:MAG: hypothetical protein M0Q49_02090 [Porticoccaceae bacterium]|jgi:hypothetical protein|nr:hypothetical protein [Porticoccaceae bacterium]